MRSVVPTTSQMLRLDVRDSKGLVPSTPPTIQSVRVDGPDGQITLANPAGAWDPKGYFPQPISSADLAEDLLYRKLRLTWRFSLDGSVRTEYFEFEVREDDSNVYGSVADVIGMTGLAKSDFGTSSYVELGRMVFGWLRSATSFINEDRGRTFDDEPGIDSIATRIASNMAVTAKQRRASGIVKVSEFTVKLIEDEVITDSIIRDLSVFNRSRKAIFGMGIA